MKKKILIPIVIVLVLLLGAGVGILLYRATNANSAIGNTYHTETVTATGTDMYNQYMFTVGLSSAENYFREVYIGASVELKKDGTFTFKRQYTTLTGTYEIKNNQIRLQYKESPMQTDPTVFTFKNGKLHFDYSDEEKSVSLVMQQ